MRILIAKWANATGFYDVGHSVALLSMMENVPFFYQLMIEHATATYLTLPLSDFALLISLVRILINTFALIAGSFDFCATGLCGLNHRFADMALRAVVYR